MGDLIVSKTIPGLCFLQETVCLKQENAKLMTKQKCFKSKWKETTHSYVIFAIRTTQLLGSQSKNIAIKLAPTIQKNKVQK